MNLFMQGVPVQNINMRNANTLEDDWPYFDEQTAYSPLFVDAVVSNPPYSAPYNPEEHQTDERYKGYGLAPAGKADYAFLLHCLYHIKNDGVMAIVLPNGVLFRGDSEGEIRKNLILNHNIETIISFPQQIFFATPIPVIVMILSKNRHDDDILFVDASQSYKKDKKQNVLTESDVQKIFDTVIASKDVPNYAHVASMDEIEANGFNLNVPRYVSATTQEAPYDLFSVMTGKVSDEELTAFNLIWKQFPALREKLLYKVDRYNDFADVDVKDTVFADSNVQVFLDGFNCVSEDFRKYLVSCLINHNATPALYNEIMEKLFEDYKNQPLIDIYSVFQAFSDNWAVVDSDLARLEIEGWDICSETEPNMVTKKDSKTKKTVEEQKGWKGKVMPFDLVEAVFYADDFDEMSRLTAEADAKASEYADIWESMDNEAKSSVCMDDDERAFDVKKFNTAIKSRNLDAEAVDNINAIQDAISSEKALRKRVKTLASNLEDKAKEKVESLSEEEICILLERKWITPVINSINGAGENVLTKFVTTFDGLKKKYSDPLSELSGKIEETNVKLKASLSELTGNDTDMAAIKMLLEEL